MTKSKKANPKPRQTPYPAPATTTNPNNRSTPAAPPTPVARFFPSVPRFAFSPAYTQNTLTPYENSQTIEEFCRDLRKNGTRTVDKSGSVGSAGVRDFEGFDERASESAQGERARPAREGESERIDEDGGVGGARDPTKRLVGLSKKEGGKEKMCPPYNKDKIQPPTGPLQNLPPALDPNLLEQHPKSPKESPTPEPSLTPPDPLTDEQTRLAQLLEPVAEFNARTPWPTTFHEHPTPRPKWHAECPEGYEPTPLAGYSQRRQYPIYNPAAHDADIVRDESGHCCLDLDPWDRCLFGKCGGCDVCRP